MCDLHFKFVEDRKKLRSLSRTIGISDRQTADKHSSDFIGLSVQCHELHWTDNNDKAFISIVDLTNRNYYKYNRLTSCYAGQHCTIEHKKISIVNLILFRRGWSSNCSDVLSPVIASMINCSFSISTFPACDKHAIVKPHLKKPSMDPFDMKLYRPVSSL